jgi:hypothetical protein
MKINKLGKVAMQRDNSGAFAPLFHKEQSRKPQGLQKMFSLQLLLKTFLLRQILRE